MGLVKNSLHDKLTLPYKVSSVVRAMDTVILLSNFPLPGLWRIDNNFDNDVQGESAGWNILEQTPIHSKFHNNLFIDQSLDTLGLRPNLARKDILTIMKK